LHIRYFLFAGGLWRDEITSLNIANIKSLSEALANLYNDSFPAGWLLTLRFWQKLASAHPIMGSDCSVFLQGWRLWRCCGETRDGLEQERRSFHW